VTTGVIWEVQQSLSSLAGHSSPPYLEEQLAANLYAGTSGLDLQAALNCKYRGVTSWGAFIAGGYTAYDTQQVANLLAGTTGKETQDALSNLAGGGHT